MEVIYIKPCNKNNLENKEYLHNKIFKLIKIPLKETKIYT